MSFWRQLRWRIVGANMLVVLVGVVVVLLAATLITRALLPESLAQQAEALFAGSNISAADQQALLDAASNLLETFRGTILVAVAVAALSAVVVGLVASMLLARQILRPLTQLAHSSQRIASGHYDERMPVGGSDELAQMATSFNQMAEALDQVEQTRVTLIGDVSHELRTPLTSLSGYLEGMLDGVFPDTEETLGLMYGEVRRMRRLVDDLQTLSRVEAGQISLHMGTFDLRALAERAVSKLQPQWQMQDVSVAVKGPQQQLLVYADPDRVDQILLNLLGNALANTPEGGEITVRLGQDGRFARVDVVDNGAGIPAEQLPFLFERFFRADRSRSSGGSGIGLTISRHLVWAMGGDLAAYSDGPGTGSKFSFTLPTARNVTQWTTQGAGSDDP